MRTRFVKTGEMIPMDNIRIIYRILSVLEASMDTETFDERSLSPETMGITCARLLSLLRMLIQEGLIEGISVDTDAAGNFLVSKERPRLTPEGPRVPERKQLDAAGHEDGKGNQGLYPRNLKLLT